MFKPAILALEDGTVFEGVSIGYATMSVGEVVFNTAMTGYQEILTDPSYARQMVTLTYPHIGNTGVNDEDEESDQIHAAGLIIRDLPTTYSNWRAKSSLGQYLKNRKTPGIAEIDTRKLTRLLREKGAQNGCLMAGEIDIEVALNEARAFPGLKGMDLAKTVTITEKKSWQEDISDISPHKVSVVVPMADAHYRVVAYDFGVKRNILRLLTAYGCDVTLVPATTPARDVMAMQPDGVFLSNGPGDPEPCDYAIEAIQSILSHRVPVFGICLGYQLLSLASGAKTMKMKFGHHGANHPVQDLDTGKVLITSQNHGFAVDEASLPDCLRATHRSLFDGSLQGVERTDVPAFGFQGHPEASPGPVDIDSLFARFIRLMWKQRGV
ncbi:MAG: carbamoyl-phosphate synthase small subunit [Gammaproteobacteria bacterium]|nr:MAG: carbamoyl-phosphate synthase small subunit [Gammaproteobacteria bacterium]